MDTAYAISRCETLVPTLDPELRKYLEMVIQEARMMRVVRELVAGLLEIDEE